MTIKLTPDIGKNFCYAPWTNIHINTMGDYKTCCAGKTVLGNLKHEGIDDAITLHNLLNIKTAILNNQEHPNCDVCIKQEDHSSRSEREWYNDIAENADIVINDINAQSTQNLDIRWSNTCNLSCTYCGKEASSIWAQLTGDRKEKPDYGHNLSKIMEYIDSQKTTIKNLGLLGGEPLLQKENEVLLNHISDDIHVNVITNLSMPLEKNKIFNRLVAMNNVTWDISFETIGDRFEYVRRGASWATMLKNIRFLKDAVSDKNGHNIGITGQYSVYNCLNLSEVYESMLDNNLPYMVLSELIYPHILSVASLPTHLLRVAANESLKSMKYATTQSQRSFLKGQYDSMTTGINDSGNIEALYEFHRTQERNYWPNAPLTFEKLWADFRQ